MGLKSHIALWLARKAKAIILKKYRKPSQLQSKVFRDLMRSGSKTRFGQDHGMTANWTPKEFKKKVQVRDYEGLKPWVEQVLKGKSDVLWPGKPIYLCKTSGTTSGVKYIPLTKESMPNHIDSARNALFSHIAESGSADFVDGKMIFLQGSPKMEKHTESKIPLGRLSGIVANHVPSYLQRNRMPSYRTNCIEDWETKLDAIVEETLKEDMRLISGIPSWVQMYFERLLEKTGKSTVKEIFPNFSLFVYGGVNYEPYRARFEKLIGKKIPSIELYPASEGFIAWQDKPDSEGLLLVLDKGIYYEFIPAENFHDENPPRLSLEEVELNVNYVIILSTNAGLWAYNIGDTVKFTSLKPPRIKVTGRIKHYTSAFGEHVIAEEVEGSLQDASQSLQLSISEFTVAPQVSPESGLPYHEWFMEMQEENIDLEELARLLDESLQKRNPYYKDLIQGKILRPLVITPLRKGALNAYMKSEGKLGGQNKVPRLSNNRKIADFLSQYRLA